ncbi:NB-ARC domain-containing protein [Streptomyces sp. LZ34]
MVVAALQGLVSEPSSPGGWVIFGVLAVAGAGVAVGGVRTQSPPSLEPPEPAPIREWIVDREERRQAEDAVCGTRGTVGITTSLSGAGGFGKTTLAELICASPRVRKRYKGGVYSFAIGREARGRAEIAARVAEIARFITGDTEQFSDPNEAGRHLGRLLDQRKRTLLFLDDVWTEEQLEPFLQGGTNCVRLITTRVPSLLPAGTRTIRVDQMTLDQARAVLTWELDGLPALTAGALLDATGRWPLLLRLVNRQIKAQVETGQDLARAAEEMLHQLRVQGPQGVDPSGATIGVDRPEDRRRAIRATVEAATDLLPEGGMDRFAELAIFAEDEAVPVPLIARLWRATGALSERASRDLCAQLARLSLLTLTADNGGRISLHDVIRDYLLGTHDPTRLAALHGQLVDASADDLPDTEPHTLTSYPAWWELADGYLQDHLIEHLVAAGRIELAEAVASDLRWVEERLVRHGSNAPQRDLSHVPTADAASRTRSLAQVTHLLAPADPAPLVVNTLYSRLAFLPSWRTQITARLDASPARPLLVGLRPPPDLPDRALLATLTGSDRVRSVAISPDGTWLATGSANGEVRLWDRASGRCTTTLTGHTRRVNAVVISPDGTWLATGSSWDETVRLWDRASGRCTTTLTGHTRGVNAVMISPDGNWLATLAIASGDPVRLWDRASGRCTTTLTGHAEFVTGVAISPDGTWLATSSWDETVRLWDRASGRCTTTLTGHTRGVTAVAISPDGTWLATTSGDRTVRLWDRASGRCTTTLTGHTDQVIAVAISPDGTWLATTSRDRTVRLWDRASGRCTTTLTGHTDQVIAVAISPDGTWLATTSVDKTMRLWDRASERCTKTLGGHTDQVSLVAIAPDGTWLATTSGDKTVRLWDPANMAPSTDSQAISTSYAAIPPNGALGSGDADEALLVRSANGECTATIADQFGPSSLVAISPDGTWLATRRSGDKTVRLWDRASGRCTTTLTGHTAPVIAVAISPDGTWLATTSGDKTVRLWDRASGQCTTTLTGEAAPVIAVAISPDGTWLATTSGDKTVRLWDRASGQCTTTLTGEAGRVIAVAISPDGTWLATGRGDGKVRLWDRASGRCTTTLTGHTDQVSLVAISPDGTWLATRSWDGAVRLWDRASGRCTKTFIGEAGRVIAVAISPDGAWLASVSKSGDIRVWNVLSRANATLVRTDDALTGCMWASDDRTFVAVGARGLHLFELRT